MIVHVEQYWQLEHNCAKYARFENLIKFSLHYTRLKETKNLYIIEDT